MTHQTGQSLTPSAGTMSRTVERDVSDETAVGIIEDGCLCPVRHQTGYKWARRWKAERSSGEKSRRPKHSPSATPLKLVKLTLSQKRQYLFWGPVPIRRRLQTLLPKRD